MRILKQNIIHDRRGRVLGYSAEHLSDDGRGRTRVVNRSVRFPCRGCGRPMDPTEPGIGRCEHCGAGPLCGSCGGTVQCGVCARRTCRCCRRGYVWAGTPLTACPPCFRRLNRRALYEQAVARQARTLNTAMHVERLRLQQAAFRLRLALTGSPHGRPRH